MFTRDHYNEDHKNEKEFWICIQNLNEEIPRKKEIIDPSEPESDPPCSISFHPDFAFGTAAISTVDLERMLVVLVCGIG